MLENTRISGKIGVVIALLAVVAAIGSVTGVVGMTMLSKDAHHIMSEADSISLSAAMNQSLLVINRSEYRLGMAPEDVGSVKKIVAAQRRRFLKNRRRA